MTIPQWRGCVHYQPRGYRHRGGEKDEDIDVIKIKSGTFHMPRLMMSKRQGRQRGREEDFSLSFGSVPRSHSSRTLPTANFYPTN